MKTTRRFKARESLLSFLSRVLSDRNIQYREYRENGILYIEVGISGMKFRKMVERALCLEQQGDSKIPVFSFDEVKRGKNQGIKGYSPLKKDEKRFEKFIYQTGEKYYQSYE